MSNNIVNINSEQLADLLVLYQYANLAFQQLCIFAIKDEKYDKILLSFINKCHKQSLKVQDWMSESWHAEPVFNQHPPILGTV